MMELRGWHIAFAGIENFILFNTALSVAAFSVAYFIRRSGHGGHSGLTGSWHPGARARVYVAALAVPPLLSAWLVCASLFPALWLGEETWAQEHTDRHSLHLLNAFTVVADPMLGYASLIFTLLALLVATWAAWRAYFRINRLVECLEIGAEPAPAESIWALTVCRYATPAFPLTSRLYRWLNEEIEIVCDEIAVRRTEAPVDLAGALVRLKRLTLAGGMRMLQVSGSGFFDDDRENFERRVTRALSLEDAPPQADVDSLSRSCVKMALAVIALFALSLVVLFCASPLAVHRAMESVLQTLHS